ncbi:MAG TPA: DUF1292 domain-containing protein [Bacillota bacterium]|jgi:hypothetical protein|nr:DUF1292 domain-containing protein [Fastidiosipila sp.]HPX92718.1 DUF1292 domain-containing protein [Bacillota bacterium]HQB80615.1 DUF1292 domain-containing protein [Bacillota bacterium]
MKNFQVLYMAEDEHDYSGEEEVDELFDEDAYVVLTDTETGEDYSFIMADTFSHDGEEYCVLVDPSEGDEDEMSLFFMKFVAGDDGEEVLVGLDEDEDEAVYQAYQALLEECDHDGDIPEA